jgi:hypothetical protein
MEADIPELRRYHAMDRHWVLCHSIRQEAKLDTVKAIKWEEVKTRKVVS